MKRESSFLAVPDAGWEKARVVLLPLPFDGACSWQTGASRGPQAIIDASANVELYDVETDSEPCKAGFCTLPAPDATSGEALAKEAKEAASKAFGNGKFLISLGGDHSVSYGPIAAAAGQFKGLTILHLDAHSDRRDSYEGNPFSHACIMARAAEFGCRIVSVGIRSMDLSERNSIPVEDLFLAEAIRRDTGWMEKVISRLGPDVYLSLDVDVFDPAIMPSTGTPEPGGLSWYQVIDLLKEVCLKRNLVGADITELLPGENPGPDFVVAKLISKLVAFKFRGEL